MHERGRPERNQIDPASPAESVVDGGSQRFHPPDARWEATGDEDDSRGGRSGSNRRSRLLRLILGLAGGIAIAVAFVRSLHSSDLSSVPSPVALVLAGGCMIVNILLSGIAWAALFDRSRTPGLVRGYFFSLLG